MNRNLLIIKSYFKPFLICLIIGIAYYLVEVFSILFSKVNLGKVSFNLDLKFIYYNIGWIITLTIPFAFLISTIFVFSHLSYEKIYEEFKHQRHSFSYLIFPIGFLTIILSITLFIYNDNVLPNFNYKAKNTLYNLMRRSNAPKETSHNEKDITLPRDELSMMNLNMLHDYINHLTKSREYNKGKSQRLDYYFDENINKANSEIQKRYAISFSPLFLLVFGFPLGFLIRNKKTIIVIIIAFASWIFYYFIFYYTNVLAQIIEPIFLWLFNFVSLLVGILFLIISNTKFKKLGANI